MPSHNPSDRSAASSPRVPRTARWVLACAVAAASSACENDLSNAEFAEDARYAGAVPVRESVHVESPEGDTGTARAEEALDGGGREPGERALAVDLTLDVAGRTNAFVFEVLDRLRDVVSNPPTLREAGRRAWGPYPWPDDASSVRLEVEETSPGVFDYRLELAAVPRDEADAGAPWETAILGTFSPSGEDWDGAGGFVFDAGVVTAVVPGYGLSGVLTVEHAREGGASDVRAALEGWSDGSGDPLDGRYEFTRDEEGAGSFDYRAAYDLAGGAGSPREDLALRVRWRADRAGRADAWVSGGDVDGDAVALGECWGADLAQTWFSYPESSGDEGSCVFGPDLPPL